MRFFILVLALVLASCVTPKTAPQSYYAGVYTPGKVEIKPDGHFLATAGVIADDNISIARKAAYARFMLEAKQSGYHSFEVIKEETKKLLGTTFRLTGKAYKSAANGVGVYPLDAVKRLLRDLPLEEPKPVYVAPKPVKKAAPVKSAKAVKSAPANIQKPADEEAVPASTEDPLVIMAPTDITGSIKKANASSGVASGHSSATLYELERQSAVSNIPNGVLLRKR